MKRLFTWYGIHRKLVAAEVTSVIGWATVVIASPMAGITSYEWLLLATAGATGIGVYAAPNESKDSTNADSSPKI